MPWVATVLLVVSAFTHAIWNLLAKRSAAPLASLWWTLAGATALAGVYLGATGRWAWPAGPALWLLPVGGVAEAVYLYALTRAYSCGDLSLAYPISRGSAPVLVALWAALLWGERLPWGGYAGIALLVVGIVVTAADRFSEVLRPFAAWRYPAARWALLSGLGISVYSMVDKASLAYLSTDAYNFWAFAAMVAFLVPLLAVTSSPAVLGRVLRLEWRAIAAGTVLVPATSLLVLNAMALAPASYVTGLRGLSVPAGALLARLVLSERLGPVRVAAAGMLAVGTACLAWSG